MIEIINTYVGKDGRVRAYYNDENGKHKTVSYPRLLMENKLGRKLLPDEDVHHIDGNKLNNDLSNLQIKIHSQHVREHAQKYFDKIAKCDVCQKEFVWSGKKQVRYYIGLKRGKNRAITCSKSCAAKINWKLHNKIACRIGEIGSTLGT